MKKWISILFLLLVLPSAVLAQEWPVYSAIPRSEAEGTFFDRVDPAWFNPGETTYQNQSRKGRSDCFTYADGAQLLVDEGYIRYEEYDGEYYMIYGDDPAHPGGPFARPSFACEVARMVQDMEIRARYEDLPVYALENETPESISLQQADQAVRTLLNHLGLEGYELTRAVDMTAERIGAMGTASVEKHQQMYNVFDRYYDFSQAQKTDEGYYLCYGKTLNGLKAANPDTVDFEVYAFVDGTGVSMFELHDGYEIGQTAFAAETLLTEAEIRECFEKDNPRREKDGYLNPELTGMELQYGPMRAPDKKDGMVMAPVWYVTYDFTDGVRRDGWAWYSALDGKLIMDCYN